MQKGILIILDGYGEGKPNDFNAVENANTPYLHSLKTKSHSLLKTDGEAVGLFKGDMGGSEVGHMTMGAGKIVLSTLKRIDNDFKSGEFKNNKKLEKAVATLQKNGGNLHLIGMMSDKNIHSNINHAFEIIKLLHDKAKNIFLHLITDGRDTPPQDSLKYLKQVKAFIKNYKNCQIASISGRAYAMDREENWDRTEKAINAMFKFKKQIKQDQIESYLAEQHSLGKDDQFIEPTHVETTANFTPTKKDLMFVFNFREDRLRQLCKMFEQFGCPIITMARVNTANTIELYPAPHGDNTLCEHLSKLGLKQIKICETTKYAHLTYFFNGGEEKPFPNEDRIHIPSFKVENFASTPKMRAKEIADETINAINQNYDAIYVNFSNPDMIGHTGNYEATVKALEFLDKCVKKVCDYALKHNYFLIVTADHGNSEEMRTKNGEPHMAHTLNPVFCIALGNKEYKMKKHGELKDVAPTFLSLMGAKPNKSFEGNNLIENI